MNKLKIAFSGIGGVGGYYGGMLAARYQGTERADIFFVARGENLKAIRENGLRIKAGIRTIRTAPALATDNPTEIGPVDYLFCCTKSYDLENNLRQLAPMISPETVIIPLLNGIGMEERIHAIFPGVEVWKGCVYIGARLAAPGFIEKFSPKENLFFGHEKADKKRQFDLLKLFIYARLNAINPTDIDTRIWKKFFMISTAATATSFFNQTIDEVLTLHTDLFISLGSELRAVTEALGIHLPDDIIYTSIEAQQMMPTGSTTSMHSDFLAGKSTELEELTGYVVREAERLGIDVPTYRFMYDSLSFFPQNLYGNRG